MNHIKNGVKIESKNIWDLVRNLILIVAVVVALKLVIAQNDTYIAVNPSHVSVSENDTFVVSIDTTSPNIFAVQLEVGFDNSMLEVLSVEEGDLLSEIGSLNLTYCYMTEHFPEFFQGKKCYSVNSTIGKITFENTRLVNTSVSGSGSLVEITFRAKSKGNTYLDLESVEAIMIVGSRLENIQLPDIEIHLEAGWNLFSPIIEPTDENTDKNILLKQGWNLFGHSSEELFYWQDAMVDKGGDVRTINDAQAAGWLQATIYYFDEDAQYYKFVPGDDDNLKGNKGYWLYAVEDELTLILPNAGGSLINNSYYWMNADVDNGTDIKSLNEAQSAGWLQSTIYYFDENVQYYKFVPGNDDYVYSWRGYWLYSNEELSLVIG